MSHNHRKVKHLFSNDLNCCNIPRTIRERLTGDSGPTQAAGGPAMGDLRGALRSIIVAQAGPSFDERLRERSEARLALTPSWTGVSSNYLTCI